MRIVQIIYILFFVTFSFAYASDKAYINTNTTLYQDAQGQSALGELIVASEVKILASNGEMNHVEFIGYMPEGSPVVYEQAGVLKSGYETEDTSSLPIIGKKVDEYDTEWLEVSVKGYVKASALSTKKSDILNASKKLFESKCSMCHDLHHKAEFTPNVWPSILENMAAQAGLTKNETSRIEKYLQEQ